MRYRCIARLDRVDRMFLWDSDDGETDRVVVDADGHLIESDDGDGEPTMYDLDAIEAWCGSAGGMRDGRALLNAWNLFVDVPGLGEMFERADTNAVDVYDKLFHSSGIVEPAPAQVWNDSQLLLLGLSEMRALPLGACRS
ncbi:MAG TPA: hypothetical protein VGG28_19630 [Kofleriaceae bacterium]|jgi:hypothetical protein